MTSVDRRRAGDRGDSPSSSTSLHHSPPRGSSMTDTPKSPRLTVLSWCTVLLALAAMSAPYCELTIAAKHAGAAMEELGIDPPAATKAVIGLPTWMVSVAFLLILSGLIVKEIAVGDAVFKIALNLTVAVAMLTVAATAAFLLRLLPAY